MLNILGTTSMGVPLIISILATKNSIGNKKANGITILTVRTKGQLFSAFAKTNRLTESTILAQSRYIASLFGKNIKSKNEKIGTDKEKNMHINQRRIVI